MLDELLVQLEDDLAFSDIAVTRKSVITPDEDRARENMAYTKRTIDAAADLEVPMVCLGLHDPFTEPQKQATWFWLAEGAEDEETPENREKAPVAPRSPIPCGFLADRWRVACGWPSRVLGVTGSAGATHGHRRHRT